MQEIWQEGKFNLFDSAIEAIYRISMVKTTRPPTSAAGAWMS